jgi:hypothetical protein
MVSFTPWPLYSWDKTLGIHWIGGYMGPRTGLDEVEKIKFLTLSELEL